MMALRNYQKKSNGVIQFLNKLENSKEFEAKISNFDLK